MQQRTMALTWKQPWGTAVLLGKPVENRTWPARPRTLWLHAGARSGWDRYGQASPLVRNAWAAYARSRPDAAELLPLADPAVPAGVLRRTTSWMPFGAVLAQVSITGCHHARDCARPTGDGRGGVILCDPWACRGAYHLELGGLRPLASPVECPGKRGWWALPADVEAECVVQLALAAGNPGAITQPYRPRAAV
jgi:hypothetical protein